MTDDLSRQRLKEEAFRDGWATTLELAQIKSATWLAGRHRQEILLHLKAMDEERGKGNYRTFHSHSVDVGKLVFLSVMELVEEISGVSLKNVIDQLNKGEV